MLRARKMSAMTQARNARTVISGSLLDQTLSPSARISCNSSFRPHLHVMFVTMNYEHVSGCNISQRESHLHLQVNRADCNTT